MAPILVADPDDADREYVASILSRAGFRTAAVATGEAALNAAHEERPSLAVLEVPLGDGVSGYEVCRALRQEFGDDGVRIMFLSRSRTEPWDRAAGLNLGADDYLAKPLSADELVARVKALVRRAPERPETREVLTDRELEVLRLLARGHDQGRIARELFITSKTVGKHIEHILRKLGVHSRAEAVAVAYQRGICAPETRVRT